METFFQIVAIADGLTIIAGLIALFVKPLREKITHIKERDQKQQENFDTLKSEIKEVRDEQKISEKDALRTQLLLLIADYPGEQAEIMKLAEHYFHDLKGNWYLTSLFNRWLESNGLAKPEWFKD